MTNLEIQSYVVNAMLTCIVGGATIGVLMNQVVEWAKNKFSDKPLVSPRAVAPSFSASSIIKQRSGIGDFWGPAKDMASLVNKNLDGIPVSDFIKLALGKAIGAIDTAWVTAKSDPTEATKLCREGLKELGTVALTDNPPLQAVAALLKLKAYTLLNESSEVRNREAFNALNAINNSTQLIGAMGDKRATIPQMVDKTIFVAKGNTGWTLELNNTNAEMNIRNFSVDSLNFPAGKFPRGLLTDHEIARSIGHILGSKGKDGVWGWINQNLPMFKITQIDTIKPKPALLDAWDKSNLFQKVLMFRPTSLIVGSIADAIKEKPGVTFTFHYNPQSVESQVLSVLGFTPAQTRQHITNLFPSHSFETTLPFQALTLDAIPTAADEIAKQLSVPHYEQRL